jgi:hypothetical protein
MILSAIAERLKRRSKDDFKGRHFEAPLILQAVCWYLHYPLSYLPSRLRKDHASGIARSAAHRLIGASKRSGAFEDCLSLCRGESL